MSYNKWITLYTTWYIQYKVLMSVLNNNILTSSSFHKPGTAKDSNKSAPHKSLTFTVLFWFKSLTLRFSINWIGNNEVSILIAPFSLEVIIRLRWFYNIIKRDESKFINANNWVNVYLVIL